MPNTVSGILIDGTKIPLAFESKVTQAPKVSKMLSSIADAFAKLPALPFNFPSLPATIKAPTMSPEQLRAASMANLPSTTSQTAEKGSGPLPEVIVRRGM